MMRKLSLCMAGLMLPALAAADWELNMPRGVTDLSAETYDLHMLVLYWCIAIAGVVFGAMIYTIVRHRKSKGAEPAGFTHSMSAEVTWTIIPVIILLLMAVPSAETLIRIEDTRGPDLTVVVTGYQWRWHYNYLGENVSFYSSISHDSNDARRIRSGIDPAEVDNYLLEVDNPLVIPRDAKIRLLITSNDVIHAWWVPAFAIKKDANPGFMNEAWFRATETGTYRGQCSELCGMDHAYMPVVVDVVEPGEFVAWMDTRREAAAEAQATD